MKPFAQSSLSCIVPFVLPNYCLGSVSPSWAISTPSQLLGLNMGNLEPALEPLPGTSCKSNFRQVAQNVISHRHFLWVLRTPENWGNFLSHTGENSRQRVGARSSRAAGRSATQGLRGARTAWPWGGGGTGGGASLGAGRFLFRRQEEPRGVGVAAGSAASAVATAVSQAASVLQHPVPSDPSPLLDFAAGSDLTGWAFFSGNRSGGGRGSAPEWEAGTVTEVPLVALRGPKLSLFPASSFSGLWPVPWSSPRQKASGTGDVAPDGFVRAWRQAWLGGGAGSGPFPSPTLSRAEATRSEAGSLRLVPDFLCSFCPEGPRTERPLAPTSLSDLPYSLISNKMEELGLKRFLEESFDPCLRLSSVWQRPDLPRGVASNTLHEYPWQKLLSSVILFFRI